VFEESYLALVQGIVEIEPSNLCVRLIDGDSIRVVVWPADTTILTKTLEVLLPSGPRLSNRTSIEGGGGYFSMADLHIIVGTDVNIPAGCVGTSDVVAVFNRNEDVQIDRSP